MELSREKLDSLITCPKTIIKKPKSSMIEDRCYLRNEFDVECRETGEKFNIFMRQSSILTENFSIGLVWESKEAHKNITILRCNGLHGGNKNIAYHNSCHIHTINLDTVHDNVFDVMDAEITSEYATFSDCIYFFSTHCNIIGLDRFFPNMRTFSLFEGAKE